MRKKEAMLGNVDMDQTTQDSVNRAKDFLDKPHLCSGFISHST